VKVSEKIDGKLHQKNYKQASRRMHSLSDLIAAATTLAFLQSILQMSREESVAFVNGVDPDELADALQNHGENPFFVFSLAIIYIRAGATRTFPKRLVELVYDAVLRQSEGNQEFLGALNQTFSEGKQTVVRSLWGLCESATSEDLRSFLNQRNSSPLTLSYWLHLAVRGEKQIAKELFQILARIAQQNIMPNAKMSYADVIQAILDNQTYFLFHETNGVFSVILDKGFIGNILNLFEIPWVFTFKELKFVRKFLQKRPINASWLLQEDYMSEDCSRRLIGTVMNLANLLNSSGRLTKATLLLPENFARIGEFVHLSDHHHLEHIFRTNQVLFDAHVIPGRYAISNVLYFFMNLHLRRNPDLFSRILGALKTYGDKLLPEDLNAMKSALAHFHEDRKAEATIFAAFKCINRPEPIHCLKDHIAVIKAILNRNGAHMLQVVGCKPPKLQEIVCALRSVLPDFLLNAQILCVNEISFLPVVNLQPVSQSVVAFLQPHALAGSFPCMLQLLMTSTNLDQFVDRMQPVMSFIGAQVDLDGPNDVQYQLNLAEMFNILHACFTNLDIKMLHFNNQICALFTNPIVLDAFVADQRFAEQTRGLRNDREIARMRQECQAHCAQHGTTMAEAQRALGHVVFECSICTALSILQFTTVFQCGHSFCTGCAEQIPICSTCRAPITHRTQADSLGIRLRQDPAPQAFGQSSEDPAQKRQRQ